MITVGHWNVTGDNSGMTGSHWNSIVGHCDRVVRFYGGRVLNSEETWDHANGSIVFLQWGVIEGK